MTCSYNIQICHETQAPTPQYNISEEFFVNFNVHAGVLFILQVLTLTAFSLLNAKTCKICEGGNQFFFSLLFCCNLVIA